jgi:hypothetical protein
MIYLLLVPIRVLVLAEYNHEHAQSPPRVVGLKRLIEGLELDFEAANIEKISKMTNDSPESPPSTNVFGSNTV